jgi:protein-disulfide isomerase
VGPGIGSRRAKAARRALLKAILASAPLALGARPAAAQRALATPPNTGAPARKRAATLPLARDLAADARQRKPVVLFFDREECPYCERALREYLVPMAQDGGEARALFRQVEIDLALPLAGFDGAATTHRALAQRYGVRLSPTVIVVGPDGTPLAAPVVGLMPDFYAAYLDAAVNEAIARLR